MGKYDPWDAFFDDLGLWDGFDESERLARALADGSTQFKHLGAAQLVKHALGLKNAKGSRGFRLLYLWYDWPSEISDVHKAEIERFSEEIGDDFDFTALTYQELFSGLRGAPEPSPGYIAYLEDRYFSGR